MKIGIQLIKMNRTFAHFLLYSKIIRF